MAPYKPKPIVNPVSMILIVNNQRFSFVNWLVSFENKLLPGLSLIIRFLLYGLKNIYSKNNPIINMISRIAKTEINPSRSLMGCKNNIFEAEYPNSIETMRVKKRNHPQSTRLITIFTFMFPLFFVGFPKCKTIKHKSRNG